MISWFKDKITGFFSGIVDGVLSFLGINSPSKVFAEIGGYMAEGLGVGWDDEFSGIKRNIERGLEFGAASVSASVSGNGSIGSGTGGVTVVQNIYSEAKTAAALMREAKHAQERAVLLGV